MFQGLGNSWCIQLGMAMVRSVITNMVLIHWMKRSVSSGTTSFRQPILDSNNTEEMPAKKEKKKEEKANEEGTTTRYRARDDAISILKNNNSSKCLLFHQDNKTRQHSFNNWGMFKMLIHNTTTCMWLTCTPMLSWCSTLCGNVTTWAPYLQDQIDRTRWRCQWRGLGSVYRGEV